MRGDLPMTELILMYLNGEALSLRETERLKIWLSKPEHLKKLETQFKDPNWLVRNLKVNDDVHEIDHWRKFLALLKERGEFLVNTEEDEYEGYESIQERESTERRELTRRIKVWRYAAAAAVVLAVIGGGYWVYHARVAKEPIVAQAPAMQDLAPGGNKAVLTLANGSKIILDSASNGNLAEQGKTKVIKISAGQLSYRLNPINGKPNANSASGDANNEVLYNTITTPAGGQYQVELPDGSKVWLDASSTLRFPTVFDGPRNVQVNGQVYFEVAKDPKQPFVVVSGDKSIAVLGTSFNVNAYTDEPFFAVTLINGAVKVQEGASQETLRPGQQAQVSSGGIRVNDHVNLRQVTAWKDGLFKFYNSDIQTIMREIGRWYNVTIVYEGKIPEDRFTGTMDKSLNASDVLKILALSKVHFRIEGQRIVVMPD